MVAAIITNARISGYKNLQQVTIANDQTIKAIALTRSLRIASCSESQQFNQLKSEQVIDLGGDWLSLGGIDLQINGGLGLAFPDLELTDFDQLSKICDFLWLQGIDGFLPTIVTTAIDKIQRSLFIIAEFMAIEAQKTHTAKILGVHLEGPFLNYDKRGAHPAQYLLPLTIANIKQVLGNYSDIVKVMTLAPELDSSGAAVDYLLAQNIVVSLGHSLATETEAKKVFQQGASMVTHAFNAMPSLHHRQPGLLGAAIINPDVYCGLIADGNHVCPTMLEILLKASNYDRGIFLVSDALAPIGLPEGVYPWDDREIKVINGTAKLTDGTLAGTTLPLLVGVQNLVQWGCNLENAIAMATESPRKAIGLSGIGVGQRANLLRWHWDEAQQNLTWERFKY